MKSDRELLELAAKAVEPVVAQIRYYEKDYGRWSDWSDYPDLKYAVSDKFAEGFECRLLYTNPAHDDTALLRQVLEKVDPLTGEQIELAWMQAMRDTPGTTLPIHEFARAVEAAVRERLGEKV